MAHIKIQTLWPKGNIPSLEMWLEATPFRTVGRMFFINVALPEDDDDLGRIMMGNLAPSFWDIETDPRTPLEKLPESPEEL